MKRFAISSILIVLVTLAGAVAAQRGPAPAAAGTTTAGVTAANTFLGMLDAAERAKAAFPFDSPQKTNWSNLPNGVYQRNSLRLGDLTPEKRAAALALVAAVLSTDGYRKVTDIMNGDEVLRGTGGGQTGGRAGAPAGGAAVVAEEGRQGRHVWFGRVLYRCARYAFGVDALDDSVWRSPPRNQRDYSREEQRHHTEPARCAAGQVHVEWSDDPAAG